MTGWSPKWAARQPPPSAGPPGIERLAMLLDAAPPPPAPVAVIPIGDAAEAAAIDILQSLRADGIRAEMAYRGNLKRRMERANRTGARAAVILGDDDIARWRGPGEGSGDRRPGGRSLSPISPSRLK